VLAAILVLFLHEVPMRTTFAMEEAAPEDSAA
jgi:hypothetical protein